MNRRRAIFMLAAPSVAVCAKAGLAPILTQLQIVVHKNEHCHCCKLWVQHLEREGFLVKIINENDLSPTRERLGVPRGKEACHTAEIDGYFVEGHVPADDIRRLLRERPAAKGITVPGMPEGSPGMEVPSGKITPYDVLLVAKDGSISVYVHHD